MLALGVLLLWTGRGMVIPFLVIFFTQIIGLSGSTVGTGIALTSLTGIVLLTYTAGVIDRRGGKPVLVTTVAIMAVATLGMAWAENTWQFVLASLLLYCGSQTYWPSLDSVTTTIVEPAKIVTTMSLLRVLMSMGIGLGGFAGGVLVANGGLPEYRLMIMLSGGLIALASLFIWWLVPSGATHAQRHGDKNSSWRAVLADREFVYAISLLFIMVLGFTQITMSVPAFLRDEASTSEGIIGTLFLMNTLIVIICQVPVAGWVDRGNTGWLFAVAALSWVGAFALLVATPDIPPLAFAVFVAFTAGELLFMPISSILAVRMAPEHLRGRYFSLLSVSWGASFAIATFTAGTVLDSSNPGLLWLAMMAVMAGCTVGALRLRGSQRLKPPLSEDLRTERSTVTPVAESSTMRTRSD